MEIPYKYSDHCQILKPMWYLLKAAEAGLLDGKSKCYVDSDADDTFNAKYLTIS